MTNNTLNLLIPVVNHTFEEGEETPTVNARNLYAWLEVETKFADWIKRRIEEYGFLQDVDFSTFHNFENRGENSNLGTRTTEYLISLDMAKELAMVEKTPKGKEARRYFIACEKTLKAERARSQIDWNNARRKALGIRSMLGLKSGELTQTAADLMYQEIGLDLSPYVPKPVEKPAPKTPPIDESIEAWFNACVVLNPDAKTNVGNADKNPDGTYKNADKWLYPNYCAFCDRENHDPVSLRRFSGLLVSYSQQKGLNVKRPHREREGTRIKGICLA